MLQITNLQLKVSQCFLCSVTEQNVSKTVFKIIIFSRYNSPQRITRTDEHYTSKTKKQ
jgi:hypothetical protein